MWICVCLYVYIFVTHSSACWFMLRMCIRFKCWHFQSGQSGRNVSFIDTILFQQRIHEAWQIWFSWQSWLTHSTEDFRLPVGICHWVAVIYKDNKCNALTHLLLQMFPEQVTRASRPCSLFILLTYSAKKSSVIRSKEQRHRCHFPVFSWLNSLQGWAVRSRFSLWVPIIRSVKPDATLHGPKKIVHLSFRQPN